MDTIGGSAYSEVILHKLANHRAFKKKVTENFFFSI